VLLVALPLLAATLGLLAVGDLGRHLWATLGLLAAGFAGLIFAARRLEARGAPAGALLGVALLLRLVLLPLAPTLSDDLYRYLWDGRVTAAGANPYRLAPDAPELAPLRDDLWRRLPHREVPTVYPPLALALFALASRLPAPVVALKALLVAADLAGCWLLLRLAGRLGVPPERAVWYAWNPLVTLEVAAMGHVDAAGVAAAVAAVWALAAARPVRAALATAAGALTKLVPLAALPAWARASGRPGRFTAVALGTVAAAAAAVVAATGGVPRGLVVYGVSWQFNGPLFEPLWRLLAAVDADSRVARGLDLLKRWSGRHEAINRLYPYVYPELLAKLLLAAGMVAILVYGWRARQPLAASGRLFGGLLLLSATVYPWYLLWVLPWAALARQPAWLALSALLPLAYLPQHAGVPLWPWVFAAVWLPFWVLLARYRRWSVTP
jgi:alpha-1,6-mannosyltransferase